MIPLDGHFQVCGTPTDVSPHSPQTAATTLSPIWTSDSVTGRKRTYEFAISIDLAPGTSARHFQGCCFQRHLQHLTLLRYTYWRSQLSAKEIGIEDSRCPKGHRCVNRVFQVATRKVTDRSFICSCRLPTLFHMSSSTSVGYQAKLPTHLSLFPVQRHKSLLRPLSFKQHDLRAIAQSQRSSISHPTRRGSEGLRVRKESSRLVHGFA